MVSECRHALAIASAIIAKNPASSEVVLGRPPLASPLEAPDRDGDVSFPAGNPLWRKTALNSLPPTRKGWATHVMFGECRRALAIA